ncbi:unnamed protein product [Cunninghamella blakesleeana]
MYCDKPLRVFLTVYIARLAISSPLNIYLHLAPRRQRRRLENHAERGENYAMQPLNFQHQSIPSPSISMPTATYSSNPSNTQSITYPRPIPPMVYPPPTENMYHNNALYNWIDRTKSALDFFATLWFIIGNYMLFTSTTCSETARPIYYLSLAVVVYGYIIISVPLILCTSVIFCLPCVLVGMRLLHIEDGVDMGGASADDINQIPVYRFKSNKPPPPPPPRRAHPQLHHHHHHSQHDSSTDNHQKGKYTEEKLSALDKIWVRLGWMESPSEQDDEMVGFYDELEIPNEQDQVCAICLSTYENGDILCRLWCYHHFHKTCVTEWLLLNCKCPLCLRDCRRYKEQQHPDHFSTARSNITNNNYSNIHNNENNDVSDTNSGNGNENNTNNSTNYDSNNDINATNSTNSNDTENIIGKNNTSNCDNSITKNSNLKESNSIE